MPEPVSINRRADDLRDLIAAELLDKGSSTVHVNDIRVTLDTWRKLARAAA
ncbi:MAG: hypothetical protein JWR04_1416, partial [Rhodoglobus sp.]|nr:hypothetical protein [Rhodoglobus sp.]MCU1410709.1 hypothetical protein [Rhodoglobus sp.]